MSGFSGATGVPKKYVDDKIAQSTAFMVITTVVPLSSISLAANTGIRLKSITSYTVIPPTGYKILMHTNVAFNGIAGVFATIDGVNQYSQESPEIFVYNTQHSSVTGAEGTRVVIATLCVPS